MHIDISELNTLWLENENGEKKIPKFDEEPDTNAIGFVYQHSMFPFVLRHQVLKMVIPKDVFKCGHLKKYIVPTHGWVDGIEGRECKLCNGTQVKPIYLEKPGWFPKFLWPKIKKPWPRKWDAHGSRPLIAFESSWPEDLVLSMANGGEYTLSQSIIIAATSCERCLNALAYKYGLDWGYCEGSEDWLLAGTSCSFCS